MQRVFRVVDTVDLSPVGTKTTSGFNKSVRDNGVVVPIIVAEVPDDDGVLALRIIDGNRRVRAATIAGLEKVPAVVLKQTTTEDRSRLTLICNHLRSLNFYTESLAVTAMGVDERMVEREARAMGLSVARTLGMVRKLEQMPDAVRTAMYDERLQVSSATDIAGWPPGLQDEVVALLQRRGALDTRAVAALKDDWEARNGPISPRAGRRRPAPPPHRPPDEWDVALPVPIDAPARSSSTDPAEHRLAPGKHRDVVSSAPVRPGQPAPSDDAFPAMSVSQPAATPSSMTPRAPEGAAFVTRLDATLADLAREARQHTISREVWVDRAMRAWERAGGS